MFQSCDCVLKQELVLTLDCRVTAHAFSAHQWTLCCSQLILFCYNKGAARCYFVVSVRPDGATMLAKSNGSETEERLGLATYFLAVTFFILAVSLFSECWLPIILL